MSKKILVICTVASELVTKYQEILEYKPLSNEETDQLWLCLLQQYQPQSIIFGLQTIDSVKCSTWRNLQPAQHLQFIRKGTSLHRVDFAASKQFNIEVLNTPGVNAPYVAEFVLNILNQKSSGGSVGVLGVGCIGKKIVTKLLANKQSVTAYNRTHYVFDGDCRYESNIQNIFNKCEQVAICLPLTQETQGIITAEHILQLPANATIVTISPPKIFSAAAIVALHERRDIIVIFDHVQSGLSHIYESLGHVHLRRNFSFDEKAAASYECQYAMAEAAILTAKL